MSMFSAIRALPQRLLRLALAAALVLAPAAAWADTGRFTTTPAYRELTAALEALPAPGAVRSSSPEQRQRRADLEQLQQAIAQSDGRAQITNGSSHSVGLYARSKKDPAGSTLSFTVLAPGHETDDDYSVSALYLPPDVSLAWGQAGGLASAAAPRLARVLDGQRIVVSDPPAPSATAAKAASTTTGKAAAPATAALCTAEGASPGVPVPGATPTSTSGTAPAQQTATAAPAEPASPETIAYVLNLPVFGVAETLPSLAALPGFTQAQLDLEPETAPVD